MLTEAYQKKVDQSLMKLASEVYQKVNQSLMRLASHYNKNFIFPKIEFNLRGATAGRAYCHNNTIRLNPHFLVEFTEDMLNCTVPHEVAHLVTHTVYGSKIKPHGYQWQEAMKVLQLEPTVCHSYDIAVASCNQTKKFTYICQGCQKKVIVGLNVHRKIQHGQTRWHKPCKGYALKFEKQMHV